MFASWPRFPAGPCLLPPWAILMVLFALSSRVSAGEPEAVPTFHCIGLRWKPDGGSATLPCHVAYRPVGENDWSEAQTLWFDPHDHSGAGGEHAREYRGSIVDLLPDTTYDIRLTLGAREERIIRVRTWSETFPIKEHRRLPGGRRTEPLRLTEGGSAAQGYILYESPPEQPTVLDVGDEHHAAVSIEAPFVILRGLTVRRAGAHGIVLGAVHDVVIERCDISGWGRTKTGLPWGVNLDSAIYSSAPELTRVVVQHCRLHHPRSDANSWAENGHPEGPQAITFRGSRGQLVIRYNDLFSDDDHCFNDGMGEVENFSYGGFPNRDSDIYANRISHCWDDAIEAEGANLNVRIWANRLDRVFVGLGLATTSLGPQYVFRNVGGFSRKDPPHTGPAPYPAGGYLFKLGTKRPRADTLARGAVFLYHNTMLQPLFEGRPAGFRRGAFVTDRTYGVWNVTTRNNLLHTRSPGDEAVRDPLSAPENRFDHDLYSGTITAAPGAEVHGIAGEPRYLPTVGDEPPELSPASPGRDSALRLPNFNDCYRDAGPDMGAIESGGAAPPAGVGADWTRWLRDNRHRTGP